jgi:hypothetical protein
MFGPSEGGRKEALANAGSRYLSKMSDSSSENVRDVMDFFRRSV